MALVLAGTVAPMARDDEAGSFRGRVWLGDDGLVDAVTADGASGPAGFGAAPVLDVGDAVIYPGLVDLHSHLGYNSLPLWVDPGQTVPYAHHDIWPGEPSYQPAVSWPSWTLVNRAPETLLAYVQVRALAGGTTAIQGWPGLSRPLTNRLVRSVEGDAVGPLDDPVLVSALRMKPPDLVARAARMREGRVFIYHCAEGQPGTRVVEEFEELDRAGGLQRGLAAVHCSALSASHFARWRGAAAPASGGTAGTVVWSPFSNLWLYGTTTDVPAALANRLDVSLGTDWGPSGTHNLLGELKVARLWSDRQGWGLSDHALGRMVTCVPGDTVARAWKTPLGRLEAGALGDAVVVSGRRADVWENLVAARETDVGLAVVGGRARFGRPSLMAAVGERAAAPLAVGTGLRSVTLARPDDPAVPWTWREVRRALDAVRAEAAAVPPAGRGRGLLEKGGVDARTGSGDPPGTPPLVVSLDMPGSIEATAGPPPSGRTVVIPPIEPLHHSSRWLTRIRGRGFHGGVLDALAGFYLPRRG